MPAFVYVCTPPCRDVTFVASNYGHRVVTHLAELEERRQMQYLQRQKQQQLQLLQVQQLQREELEKRQRESARGARGKQSARGGAGGSVQAQATVAVATDIQPSAPVIVRVPRKVKSAAGVPYTPLALCRAAPPPGKFCTLARIVSYWPRDVNK